MILQVPVERVFGRNVRFALAVLEGTFRGMDKRVLIVDDDPLALRMLERRLADGGYSVVSVPSGPEAMRVLCESAPSILITDWEMPEMSGLELCKAIRAHEGIGFVYIIILTAYGSDEAIVSAFDAGADDYLIKPFNHKELLARLRGGERIVSLERDIARRTREVYGYNAEIEITNRKLEQANEALNRLATTDELTGMINRRAALARLEEQWAIAARHGEPLACMMIDIDHFKSVNDTFGHAMGDRVLKDTSARLAAQVRGGDMACRIGGEEFLVICPLSTAEMAVVGAERLRKAVEASPIRDSAQELKVTVSIGVAARTDAMPRPDDLLRSADEALYTAKRSGRNRVVCATVSPEAPAAPPTADMEFRPPIRRPDPGSRERVIVFDSESERRSQRVAELRAADFEVDDADCAQSVFDLLARSPRDALVFCDPDGQEHVIELIRRVKAAESTRDVPVLLMTDDQSADVRVRALRAGVEAVCPASSSTAELVLRIRNLARLHRMLLREAAVEQPRMLTLLLEYSRALASADELESVLDLTTNVTVELTGCRGVSLILPDEERQMLHTVRSTSPGESKPPLPINGSALGGLLSSGESLVVVNRAQTPAALHPAEKPFFEQLPVTAAVLSASEHTVGLLVISQRFDCRPFTPEELGVVHLISNLAATAIHDLQMRRSRDEARDSIVVALAKLAENRDDDTGKHLDRVTQFCLMLARELRQEPEYRDVVDGAFLANLERAVPLHDIGKVAIPDAILLKPGRLTPEEMAIMRTHCEIGWETLRCVTQRVPGAGFLRMAEEIAHAHHEWFDGGGYPRGISGSSIPLAARIAALADVYDAITTRRVYKPALPHDKAVALIVRGSGSQFDPRIVKAFLRCEKGFAELAARMAEPVPRTDAPSESAQNAPSPASVRPSVVNPLPPPRAGRPMPI